jgi:alpha-D-xyloside xylohydrolase
MQMNWKKLNLVVFASEDVNTAKGKIFLPTDTILHQLSLKRRGNSFELESDPFPGQIKWTIDIFPDNNLNTSQ